MRLPHHSTLIHTLPVFEARASSEIDDIVTAFDGLFRIAQHTRAFTT